MLWRTLPFRGYALRASFPFFPRPVLQLHRRTNVTAIPPSQTAEPAPVPVNIAPKAIEEEIIRGFLEANGDGLLFFDNVYPLKTGLYDPRFLLHRFTPFSHSPKNLVSRGIPPDLPITPKTMTPRPKEGGAFLRFEFNKNVISLEEVQKRTREYLKKHVERPWFNPMKKMDAWVVQGRPWVEDLHRFPSKRLRVEFEGPDLSQETLYSMFRQFGRIQDIIPASPSSKELPRFAIITFLYVRSATAAKNCLHQVIEQGTKIHISYESIRKMHWFVWEWITSHPRITIPVAAAIFAVIMGTIFDPIRTWCIENKVSKKWSVESSRVIQWLRRSLFVPFRRKKGAQEQAWKVDENVKKIKDWIAENQESFIVVVGPKGTAKREMVIDGVLEGRTNVLVLDCEPIVEQHGDSVVIRQLAQQVGYAPIFNWLNFLSSLLDLTAQGTIGQKTGFTENLDTQVKKILNMTATALRQVALSKKPRGEKGQPKMRDEEFLEQNPQHRPVVVVDNFLIKADNARMLYENIAQWATLPTEANIAHVIFLTSDLGYAKALATDRVLRTITLRDKDPEAAKDYILRQLQYFEGERVKQGRGDEAKQKEKPPPSERNLDLDNCIHVLGGRIRDLEGLAQRLAMGVSPDSSGPHLKCILMVDALQDMVGQTASEILKLYFLGGSSTIKWSQEQAWTLVKALSQTPQISYNNLLLDPVFTDETALRELAQAEFITITSTPEGRPSIIKPGRPIFSAAFALLANDKVFGAKMELGRLTFLQGEERKKIEKAEEELVRLRDLPPGQVREIEARIRYVLKKIQASQRDIEVYDMQLAQVKEVLKQEV